ncbi:MAG: hypothetical protein M1823_002758 [Watsoniomyces obsoletus]|nr:MAG: hypothetical protein M1823_002758 [Watsoniomyces obsoletus]
MTYNMPLIARAIAQNKRGTGLIAFLITGTFIVLFIIAFIHLRRLRRRYENPRYIPTAWLKRRWQAWKPAGATWQGNYGSTSMEVESLPGGSNTNTSRTETEIDRHTSIRSVATLPVYKPTAHETEQILGREGERGGIDVVIEFPETAEEEEARRNEHMETLFQIRQARRLEAAEREDRRRRRREARERGDTVALEEIRRESREARGRADSAATGPVPTVMGSEGGITNNSTVTGLGASNVSLPLSVLSIEQASRLERERRISSVSYADVGLARHDGTRVRASSDSERPLLEGAGPMGMIGGSSRPNSPSPLNPSRQHQQQQQNPYQRPGYHRRDSSMHSVSTMGSIEGGGGVGGGRDSPRLSSRFAAFIRPTHSRTVSQTTTTSEVGLGLHDETVNLTPGSSSTSPYLHPTNNTIPPLPPEYDEIALNDEEAPPYESPTRTTIPDHSIVGVSTGGGGGGGRVEGTEGGVGRRGGGSIRVNTTTANGAPQLPILRSLPAIEITAGTPVNSTPASPVRRS